VAWDEDDPDVSSDDDAGEEGVNDSDSDSDSDDDEGAESEADGDML
jgi:hypothetical protein